MPSLYSSPTLSAFRAQLSLIYGCSPFLPTPACPPPRPSAQHSTIETALGGVCPARLPPQTRVSEVRLCLASLERQFVAHKALFGPGRLAQSPHRRLQEGQ